MTVQELEAQQREIARLYEQIAALHERIATLELAIDADTRRSREIFQRHALGLAGLEQRLTKAAAVQSGDLASASETMTVLATKPDAADR